MKRILWWGMSTLTAVVLMFGYHTSTSGVVEASVPAAISVTTTPGSTSAGTPTGGSATTSPATVTGDAVSTRYGTVQVQVAVSGGTITDVSVPRYPSQDRRDLEISQRALPILVRETLDRQSANVDMVSGATYTSDGYTRSLQSALDRAGL